jgi:D-alanyl-D-alanine carboxypeptidase
MAYKHSVRSLAATAAAAVVVLLAVAAAAMPGSAAAVGKARASVTTGAALQQALNRLVAMPSGPSGVAVIVRRGGRSTAYQAGKSSPAGHRPRSGPDHARLASFSGTYSDAVALSLVSRGKLRLGDMIGRVLPALPQAWHRVTLRDLLQHRSGLPDYTASKALRRRLARYPRLAIPPSGLLRYVWNKPLQFRPGSRYRHDSSDDVVAVLMAEAVTGRSYSELVRTLVNRNAAPGQASQTGLPSGFRLPSTVFRFRTRCGTVYAHTGNLSGDTQFSAATPGGGNSVTITADQLGSAAHPAVLAALRNAELLGVCAAMRPGEPQASRAET